MATALFRSFENDIISILKWYILGFFTWGNSEAVEGSVPKDLKWQWSLLLLSRALSSTNLSTLNHSFSHCSQAKVRGMDAQSTDPPDLRPSQ